MTLGGSKNVTNSEKGAKMMGRKRFIRFIKEKEWWW